MPLPLVAIVGAPNVGKSTLFNRLIGRRRSLVTDEPGVTRDRIYGEVDDEQRSFAVVDTGGLTQRTAAPFARQIEHQAELALDQAALVLFVIDARAGATALDRDLAVMLRRRGLPVLPVANKVDSERLESQALELHELGLGEPLPVSAEHGRGIDELIEQIQCLLESSGESQVDSDEGERPMNVAIVGRPNVGKSSLLNRLAGEERAVVSEVPGTTRDSVDTLLELEQGRYRLIDTAGIRRPGRVRKVIERFSVSRARGNIERCDVAVLVLDGSEEFAAQDAHIAGYVTQAFKPMVVAVNKWDLVEDREEQAKLWEERLRHRLRFAKEVPLVLISAKTGQRVTRVLDHVDALFAAAGKTVPTAELNRWLQRAGGAHARGQSQSLRLYYTTQTGVHPPTFVLFCNDRRALHFSMRRYLANGLRETFGFGGAPLRLRFRERRETNRS